MYAVIATEMNIDNNSPSTANLIISKLQNVPDFRGWRFLACHSDEELYNITDRPDVIVLSRYLSSNMENVFKHLPLAQPHSRFVILTDAINTRTKAFINMAEEYGFKNIVTGPLPGERPYTLLVALKQDKEDIFNTVDSPYLEPSPPVMPPAPVVLKEIDRIEDSQREDIPEPGPVVRDEILNQSILSEDTQPKRVLRVKRKLGSSASVPDREEGLPEARITVPKKYPFTEVAPEEIIRGITVVSCANKGGVGKTTSAITVAVGSSRAKIKTCLADLDLGGADIASFFKISGVSGIETLERLPINQTTVSDILYKVNDYLYILPGTMDKSYPYFSKEQISQIINVLKSMFPVTIFDTPQQFWTKEYLEPVFEQADLVMSLVDQSVFSEHETAAYAPKLLWYGVTPDKMRILLNRFSSKLHNAVIIEKHFNMNLKGDIPKDRLPRVAATIPNNWDENVLKGYKGEVVLDENLSQWRPLLSEIAKLAGYRYDDGPKTTAKKGFLNSLFSSFKKSK